jgi:hydroxymethylglutaryl-CoA lyase
VDINAVVDTAWFISNHLGRKPDSKVANAMRPT